MRVCQVVNNVVTNVILIDDSTDPADFNAVDLGEYAEIGDTVTNGASVEAVARENDIKANKLRGQRNALLADTDWWVMSDTTAPTQAQLDYRQALRDLPSDPDFPNVDLPQKP
jgi:hypothetical protein